MSTEITPTESAPERASLKRFARRGFLGTLGAGGLTAASSLFSRGQTASASTATYAYNCCNLAVAPNITYSTCKSHAYYIWYCSVEPGYLHCDCCESTYGGYQRSAGYCHYA